MKKKKTSTSKFINYLLDQFNVMESGLLLLNSVNRGPLHFNHLVWISHIVFWAVNFWNPIHYLLDEGWYFLRWRTMPPSFGAKSWQRWPWLCVHRPHLPLIHPILPPGSSQPPHRPFYQPHSSTRRTFLPSWSDAKVHDDEAFALIVVERWLCVQRPQVPPTRKVWLPTVLMILTHRHNDPQVSISDADDFIVVVAYWHNTVSVKITTKENMNAFCGWSVVMKKKIDSISQNAKSIPGGSSYSKVLTEIYWNCSLQNNHCLGDYNLKCWSFRKAKNVTFACNRVFIL